MTFEGCLCFEQFNVANLNIRQLHVGSIWLDFSIFYTVTKLYRQFKETPLIVLMELKCMKVYFLFVSFIALIRIKIIMKSKSFPLKEVL